MLARAGRKLLLLSLPAAVALLAALEILLRVAVPAASMPYVSFDPRHQVMKFDVHGPTAGLYTAGRFAEQRARWRVNNEGWNSTVDYVAGGDRAKPLIAIIGDSYVEGFHTDRDEHLGAVLRRLTGDAVDVYSFGFSGAPLSQYLQMSRYVRQTFAPDVLVLVVIHNDFDESLATFQARPHFLQLRVEGERVVELPPRQYEPNPVRRLLSRSALVRYLVLNLHLQNTLQDLRGRGPAPAEGADAGDAPAAKLRSQIELATRHVCRSLRAENPHAEIVFVIDGPRRDIYAAREAAPRLAWLHELLRGEAALGGCRFLDLSQPFREHYRSTGERLNSEYDFHWSAAGHRVAAESLLDYLRGAGILPGRREPS